MKIADAATYLAKGLGRYSGTATKVFETLRTESKIDYKEETKPHNMVKSPRNMDSKTAAEVYPDSTGPEIDYKKEKHHKHLEHLGELGAVAAGAYALHEMCEAEIHPEHGHRHKNEEVIAAAAATGARGFAFHEHHQIKETEREEEEAHGKKHYHLFLSEYPCNMLIIITGVKLRMINL